MPLTAVSGKSRLRVLDSVLEPVAHVELSKKVFTLGRGEYSYDIELYASANVLSFEGSLASLSCNL
jgi:hypothetical protein